MHINGSSCPSCNEKILNAIGTLQEWWLKIKLAFPDCHLSWTFRNEQEQDDAYNSRPQRSKLQWPNSRHNVNPSYAMDLFCLKNDGTAYFGIDYYQKINAFLVQENAPLAWGGNFQGDLKDLDHWQTIPK